MLSFYYYREGGNSLPVVSQGSLVLLQRGQLPDGDTRYLSAPPFRHSGLPLLWCGKDCGDALCWNVQTMNESSPKYLDKAVTKARAPVPNTTAAGSSLCLVLCLPCAEGRLQDWATARFREAL